MDHSSTPIAQRHGFNNVALFLFSSTCTATLQRLFFVVYLYLHPRRQFPRESLYWQPFRPTSRCPATDTMHLTRAPTIVSSDSTIRLFDIVLTVYAADSSSIVSDASYTNGCPDDIEFAGQTFTAEERFMEAAILVEAYWCVSSHLPSFEVLI